jgi:hypothetical protein
MRTWLLTVAALLLAVVAQAAPLRQERLDDFRDAAAWKASASDQVQARLRRDPDGSLCLHYDFAKVSGYAVMRRALPVNWPERFDLDLRLKGGGATNDLQVKLVDASGDNVWWVNRPNAALPATWTDLRLRSRHFSFAWGPSVDRALRRTQFLELVVAAGRDGGKGSLCAAGLALQERAPDPPTWPAVQMHADPGRTDFDFGLPREFNGITLQWPVGAKVPAYRLLARDHVSKGESEGNSHSHSQSKSAGNRHWRLLRQVSGSSGGLHALFLPESEARFLRVDQPHGSARPQMVLKSAAEWPDFNRVLATQAADAPRGDMPRAFLGQQNYWTLVGVDGGGARSALVSEDGALEVGRGGFSLEPAVQLEDGSHVTWAGVDRRHTLREGRLPLPSVHWAHPDFALQVETAADGPRQQPQLLGRYTLTNRSARAQRFTLLLAVRPWQVNPPQQFLATPGGASPVHRLQWTGQTLWVNGRTPLQFSSPPLRISALAFDGGLALAALQAAATLSGAGDALRDPQAHASALLQWPVTLAPGESWTVGLDAALAAPAQAALPALPGVPTRPVTLTQLQTRFDAAAERWRERLGRTTLQLPGADQRIADTLATSLAHMLMSRDGPALQPGTRSYARSWVRDGAMMVAGLLRLGEVDAAREFTDWFAGHIFASGKVPCCVDSRGADPVVENDSQGQYLYAVAEVLRHTGDTAWAAQHWPTVQRVVGWMEALRQSERGAANRTPERSHLFGLMPPSISHEGYSDKPAYAYWDDFWALRGYKDAVQLAQRLGHAEQAARWASWRDSFEAELAASIEATAQHWHIAHIAGAADRGDFDATSTTMALNPAQAALPRARLEATFERYWQEMNARSQGRRAYKDYTPYELRNVGALAQLGWPWRAHAMLDFFFKDQRPKGWNQWAEVVLPDPREPRFLGDMPHAWVSSDYIRSVLDLLVMEQERVGALLLGAGLRSVWLQQGDVVLRGLSTPHGVLDWSLVRNAGGWQLSLPRALHDLPGGVALAWPEDLPLPRALHAGQALPWQGRLLRLPTPPCTVELRAE